MASGRRCPGAGWPRARVRFPHRAFSVKVETLNESVTAAILAGGHARRLGGRDKTTLDIGPLPILQRQVSVLAELTATILLVTASGDHPNLPGVQVVSDLIPGAGPLGGVYTAIRLASPARALVVACDMPFLTAAFLERLVAEAGGFDAVVPRAPDGYHPLCAVYAPSAADPIHRRIRSGRLKVVDALADLRVRELGPEEIAPYDPDGTLLFNINTPDDYQRALRSPGRR